ncbi:MAG TPA: nuclear transport factor 2 family protein [Micromonosporaceae bacterium]|nr:nuclear transport factor 2 family protein [Micromonosporaceae bacterium]
MADSSAAREIAIAYYDAWTSKNIDRAMSYFADDVVCDAPAGRIEGVAAYREFLGPFTEILLDANLIAAYGDDTTAVLVYNTKTVPVPDAPGAECLTVADGKIVYNRFIFDRLPFAEARRSSTDA